MISNVRLAQIHLRLNQIFTPKNSRSTFGDKNILFFGDLLQVIIQFLLLSLIIIILNLFLV